MGCKTSSQSSAKYVQHVKIQQQPPQQPNQPQINSNTIGNFGLITQPGLPPVPVTIIAIYNYDARIAEARSLHGSSATSKEGYMVAPLEVIKSKEDMDYIKYSTTTTTTTVLCSRTRIKMAFHISRKNLKLKESEDLKDKLMQLKISQDEIKEILKKPNENELLKKYIDMQTVNNDLMEKLYKKSKDYTFLKNENYLLRKSPRIQINPITSTPNKINPITSTPNKINPITSTPNNINPITSSPNKILERSDSYCTEKSSSLPNLTLSVSQISQRKEAENEKRQRNDNKLIDYLLTDTEMLQNNINKKREELRILRERNRNNIKEMERLREKINLLECDKD